MVKLLALLAAATLAAAQNVTFWERKAGNAADGVYIAVAGGDACSNVLANKTLSKVWVRDDDVWTFDSPFEAYPGSFDTLPNYRTGLHDLVSSQPDDMAVYGKCRRIPEGEVADECGCKGKSATLWGWCNFDKQ